MIEGEEIAERFVEYVFHAPGALDHRGEVVVFRCHERHGHVVQVAHADHEFHRDILAGLVVLPAADFRAFPAAILPGIIVFQALHEQEVFRCIYNELDGPQTIFILVSLEVLQWN